MNLEERVAALEERMDMEAGLRASADRDLASLTANMRAQTHLLQALAITQSEHGELLRQHGETLAEHSAAMARVETGVEQIIGLLDRLIDRDGQ